jgi:hypothetical protein
VYHSAVAFALSKTRAVRRSRSGCILVQDFYSETCRGGCFILRSLLFAVTTCNVLTEGLGTTLAPNKQLLENLR